MGADNILSRRLKVLVNTFDVFCVEINPVHENRQAALIEQRQKLNDNKLIYYNTLSTVKNHLYEF